MGLIKNHRSLVDMIRSALAATDQSQDSAADLESKHSNHRSIFRRRNSHTSITPQSSSSSLKSVGGTPIGLENGGSDNESANSSSLNLAKKDKKKRFLRLHPRRSDSHHSLRRFFKILHPKEHLDHQPHHAIHTQKTKLELPLLPLSDVSRVSQKYNVGRFIGSGASGLVNLITGLDKPDQIYALKKFRPKLTNETEHDYITKVKNEFLVGEYLHHQNLIHTIELIREDAGHGQAPEFYIIMEYCPHDFFTLVMSGLMRKDEIFCYFKQIVNGTNYLHLSGIAHRDLKLDNCVVDTNGILKLIDFGSAFQFRKPLDYIGGTGGEDVLLDDGHKLVFARGIVGSDPYLAPEVFQPVSPMGYDSRLADVWSIAIIYCCMVLKRFPWKVPKDLDFSFRAYCESPAPDLSLDDFEHLTMKTKEPVHKSGPERLLNLLPSASRSLVKGMLAVDTTKRFLLKDILASDFYKSIDHCHYYEEGEMVAPALVWDPKAHSIAVSESVDKSSSTEGPAVSSTGDENITGKPQPSATKSNNSSGSDMATSQDATPVDSQVSSTTEPHASTPTNLPPPEVGTLIKGKSHRHHLVTEEDLERMQAEKVHKNNKET